MEQRPSSVNRMKPDAFPAQGVPVFTAITSSETAVTWSASADSGATSSDTNPCNGIIRWYEPVTGRFLSNDPIGISGGLNQYVFCANNPVNFTDAFGLDYRFIQEWGTPHTIVEIKGKDGVSRFYEWTGLGRTEDPISNLIDIDLGIWVPGHWYQPDRTPRGISLPWHKTKSCEDKALINKFDDLIGAENLSYNLYRNNSFQAPRRVVDSVLHPQPPPAGVFQIPNWNTH